jgi:hypothetical protein
MSVVKIENLGIFTYNYTINPNKKYNVISSVIFKSDKVSNFSRYTSNLLKFKNLEKTTKFVFRLYYDDSILQDSYIKKIWNKLNEQYQLVHYNCPAFKNKDGLHDGIFGSLIRFLPFHDFPENDVNCCFSTDIDGNIISKESKIKLFFKLMNEYNLNLIYTYWYCHHPSHNIEQSNAILAGSLLIKYKLPLYFLVDYVNNIVSEIFEIYKELKNRILKKKENKYKHTFFYGIDEIYNEIYLKLYFDKNHIRYGRIVSAHYEKFIDMLKKMFLVIEDEQTKIKIKKIIKSINKKFKTDYENLEDFINIFKDYDYKRISSMHEQYEIFHKKIIKMYIKNPELEKPKNFKCFEKIPIFIDDTNKLEVFN